MAEIAGRSFKRNEILFMIIVVGVIIVSTGAFGVRERLQDLEAGPDTGEGGIFDGLFDIILNVVIPESDDGATGATGETGATGDPGADAPPVENWRYPTDIVIFANPDDVDHGDWFYGAATSNGYSYAISVLATHLGSGETLTVPGFIGLDGTWESSPMQMNTPGFWTFQATAENGVVSNIATLTVRGITTTISPTSMSKTFPRDLTVEVYSVANRQNVDVNAFYDPTGVMKDVTNIQTNQYGYVSFDFRPEGLFWPSGNYELHAMIGGDCSCAYDTAWFSIGR